jgi:CRISPR-associated protein Cst1
MLKVVRGLSDIGEMEKEIIFQFTGNPFVDAGIWAICEWCQKERPEDLNKEDLRTIVGDIVPLYLTPAWSKSLYSIFPNNPITNPSVKDKKGRMSEFLSELLHEIAPLPVDGLGNCISCGRRDVKTARTKTEIPLLGSGSLVNYFPNGQSGGDYCPACTLAVQFSPLIFYSCVKLLLLHSNSDKVMRYWARRAIHDIRRQMLERDYGGCFNENFKNPRNALFHLIQDIVLGYDERWVDENPSITLYHFTNYNQGPDLDLYYVPTQVFRFLAYMRQHEKYPQWLQIVRRGYVNVDWNKVKEEGDYRDKMNVVYNNLLSGKSIVKFFIDPKERRVYGDWGLLSYYLKEVRNMETKRLETLKRVGDELAKYIKETENIKRLTQLEQARNYGTLRNILRFIITDRMRRGAEKPLFSLDEYIEDLFPEGNMNWKETQDLLLFRIYETLHTWLVEQDKGELGLLEESSTEEIAVEE